jgi:hypothetical protein
LLSRLPADVDATRADLDLRLAKLDELHNAYQNALGLKLQSEDGAPQQQWGWSGGMPGSSLEVVQRASKCAQAGHVVWAVLAGELFLEFTQISAEQPEKPYGFAVQVLEDEKYRGEARAVGGRTSLHACVRNPR